jgi:hypothetical protein
MKTIAKREKKGKRILNEQIHPVLVGTEDFDARVALIQALIPLGLAAVEEELEAEVTRLGARYERSGRLPGHVRWTKQDGSIYLGDQKHPIRGVAGTEAVVQRCRWHKRENVVSYLPKSRQAAVRREIDAAYRQPTHEMAATRLV